MFWITTQFRDGFFHAWKDAPSDLKFLSYLHRHELRIIVKASVLHGDREIEFLSLKQQLRHIFVEMKIGQWWPPAALDENRAAAIGVDNQRSLNEALVQLRDKEASVETVAFALAMYMVLAHGEDRSYSVTVLEDDENGGIYEWKGRQLGLVD